MKNNKNFFLAFTLAEILIALLMIGVVSAVVIPALINDFQEADMRIAFKKKYAEISLAYDSLLMDNHGTLKGKFENVLEFSTAFKDKFNYIKYCPVGSASSCIQNIAKYKYMDKTIGDHPSGCATDIIRSPGNIGDWSSIILMDGSVLTVIEWFKNCNETDAYTTNACTASNNAINIDVNGEKPPNVLGKDLFIILPYEQGIKPDGMSANIPPYTGSYDQCDYAQSCISSKSGSGCAAKVLSD